VGAGFGCDPRALLTVPINQLERAGDAGVIDVQAHIGLLGELECFQHRARLDDAGAAVAVGSGIGSIGPVLFGEALYQLIVLAVQANGQPGLPDERKGLQQFKVWDSGKTIGICFEQRHLESTGSRISHQWNLVEATCFFDGGEQGHVDDALRAQTIAFVHKALLRDYGTA